MKDEVLELAEKLEQDFPELLFGLTLHTQSLERQKN